MQSDISPNHPGSDKGFNSGKYPLLSRLDSPGDLKGLSPEQLRQTAAELRGYILDIVSQNGGHLASNLGVIELTLALHRVFDMPADRIVWDVGHQCYAHKILTGRRDAFAGLRQKGGLSGFPKPEESAYDSFATGHAGTAVSVALGFAKARDLSGEDYHTAAVVGDGAMTGGMVFEALNHAGDLQTRLIVVLNDNKMSIAKNVGALSKYLMRLRTTRGYTHAKKGVKGFLRRIPLLGNALIRFIERFKTSLKYYILRGMLFEEMGFTYLGPIDGHDINALETTLKAAKQLSKPVLIHVLTEKGRGYKQAQSEPQKFHGVNGFKRTNGELAKGEKSYTSVFSRSLLSAAGKDDAICAITAAMPDGTGLKAFAEAYPDRFFDVGIAEQHALTFAAGLAKAGKKPVVAIYSSFLQRGFDQIAHDICLSNLPVVMVLDHAGLVGGDGPTHQGIYDLSFLRALPNLTIMAPRDEWELAAMTETAFAYKSPVVIRYPKSVITGSPPRPPEAIPHGKWEKLREGADIALLGCGSMVQTALSAAELLASLGINATVVNARFVKPLDSAMLSALASGITKIVTIEENVAPGGFGSAVREALPSSADLLVLALPDAVTEQGSRDYLLELYGLTARQAADRIYAGFFAEHI